MSAIGTKQTFLFARQMSAIGGKADMAFARQKCLLMTQSGHLPVAEKWSILNKLGRSMGSDLAYGALTPRRSAQKLRPPLVGVCVSVIVRMRTQPRTQRGFFLALVVCFAQTTKANQIKHAVGPCVSQVGSGTMQIIRECRMRAVILTELAKDAPEFESQLLYVAEKWLMLAILIRRLDAGSDRAAHKLSLRH